MRVVAVHNLGRGGAHRRLSEQLARLSADVHEVCLGTATPVTTRPIVAEHRPRAPGLPQALRVPVRYTDFVSLLVAWRRAALIVERLKPDAVFANPCRFLQAPAALSWISAPSLYFCDEPRRVDYDPSAIGSRNPLTRPVYAPMYALERRLDRRAAASATRLATNSAFTAAEISRAYQRRAEVVALGVSEPFHNARAGVSGHLLSVGTLIPNKGHDVVIAAAARMRRRRPVVLVAPGREPVEEARLRALAGRQGVELTLRVGITDGELAALYAGAHATVCMAAREPLGLAALEAQVAGSPVVVAAEGGLPETLAPGQSHWAVPREPALVTARLDELEDEEVRRGAATSGQSHARQLSWQRSAGRIEQLLGELVV